MAANSFVMLVLAIAFCGMAMAESSTHTEFNNTTVSLDNSTDQSWVSDNVSLPILSSNATDTLNLTATFGDENSTQSEWENISNPVRAVMRYYDEERDRLQNFIVSLRWP